MSKFTKEELGPIRLAEEKGEAAGMLQNDDGTTYYVNYYWRDGLGTMRRETLADELTEKEATDFVRILNKIGSRLSLPVGQL